MFNPPAVHADAGSVRAVDLPPVPPRDAPLARTALALVPVGVAGVVAATGIIAIGWSVALVMAALVSSAALLTALVVTPLRATTALARRHGTDMEMLLNAERSAHDVQDRLDRALPMCDTEADTLRTGLRATGELVGDAQISLLLARPGEARVAWELPLGDGCLGDAKPLPSAPACAALAGSATATSARSNALDACAHVRDKCHETSSACVPLRADDGPIGVLCVQGPPGELPDEATLRRLEWITQRVGARVSVLRAVHGPAGAGRPDPLTGLPTRSALREQLRERMRSLTPFCVATLEVDGFDEIRTDDDADHALRSVAEVLCSTLRPDDAIFRLGDGRFAAVMNGCDVVQASGALERARETLVLAHATGETHFPLTFSAGVVESQNAGSLVQLIGLADAACERAVTQGGNRVSAAD